MRKFGGLVCVVVGLVSGLCALVGVSTASAQNACRGVECGGVGVCFPERGEATCLCDSGYQAAGDTCIEATALVDPIRQRHRPGVGEEVVAIARAQVGLGPYGVGRRFVGDIEPLHTYLAPHEMWCTDFVAWVYRAAEVPFDGGEGGWQVQNNFAAREWFKSRGLWIDREHDSWELFEPQPGDYVRIHTSRYGHSAIVARTEGDTLFTIEGNFTNSVRLIRHTRFRSDIRIDGFGMLALDNATPTVDAGADDLVAWSDHVVHLAGSVSDDGPNEELTVSWSRKEGPGRVIFEDPWAPSTWATFTEPGVYVLELAADDGALYATDQIVVELTEPESATSDAEGLDAAPRAAGCAATGLSGDDGTGDMASLLALVIFVSNRRRRVLRV